MSILDSVDDYNAAVARLEGTTVEQLETDLLYWAVATQDAGAEHDILVERTRAARVLHSEAQSHVTIIVQEIRKRRDAKRPAAAG